MTEASGQGNEGLASGNHAGLETLCCYLGILKRWVRELLVRL
jgi:hypothetical protein